jgi:hypothetical protein
VVGDSFEEKTGMKTRTIFLGTAILATSAPGLFAQETVTITRGSKTADEAVMMAQGPVGMVGLSGEPGNFRFMTQEFSFNGRTVTGQPYSAEEKTESVQTLADGNRITNTTTAQVYRDSQGRTRREMTLPGFGGDAPHTLITINDPIAGVNYTLDKDTKVAHEMPGLPRMKVEGDAKMMEAQAKMKAEAEAGAKATYIRRAPAPTTKHEDLGDNVMEGVAVKGSSETSTIEAGAMGNERPIEIKSERWFSPDLQIEVKSVHSDPRMGTTTHTVSNISRAEPDASLFTVPSDYSKMDEGKPGIQVRHFEVHPNQ